MQLLGDTLVYAATDLSGFLACPHLTALEHAKAHGGPKPPVFDDPAADVIRQRGHEHEARVLARLRGEGKSIREMPRLAWADRTLDGLRTAAAETLDVMRQGVDVIAQGTLFDGTWLGHPDFLVRVASPSDLGAWSYEVVDAKLTHEAKAGAVLQIALYSELLADVQGHAPRSMHLELGGPEGGRTSFRVTDYAAYGRSVRRRFLGAVTNGAVRDAYPEPVEHCTVCAWSPVCKKRWRADDHLSLVAGITRRQRGGLEARGTDTLTRLARLELPLAEPLDGVSRSALETVHAQARIQLEGREQDRHLYELFDDVQPDLGLGALPAPSEGDLFFDIEGDPHALESGLEYLFGFCDSGGAFRGLWALDRRTEKRQFEAFIDTVIDRLDQYPDMHVYHFAPYETTAVKRLAGLHGTRTEEVDRLLRGKVFVDLYRVVRQGLRASVESYSIKKLEPLYGFERAVDLRAAGSALAHFEAWLALGGEGDEGRALLDEIEAYNRDDVLSALLLRDWLEGRRVELEARGADVPRPTPPEPMKEDLEEQIERVQALMARLTAEVPADPAERPPEQHARWLLAQLLEWHRREHKSLWWEYFARCDMTPEELLEDRGALGGLTYEGVVDTVKRSEVHRYRFPKQEHRIGEGDKPHDPGLQTDCGKVVAVNDAVGVIDLIRGKKARDRHPTALVPYEIVGDGVLRGSLFRLAESVAEGGLDGTAVRSSVDLLMRKAPRAGGAEGAPLRGAGEPTLDAAVRLALALDRGVLPVQGPPGSGKTYTGARMILALLRAGRRVGVTAVSHKVIGNLLEAVCEAARETGEEIEGVQSANPEQYCGLPEIRRLGSKEVAEELAAGSTALAAGTAWLWSREDMHEAVDVLFVDEAGQMSLANALAAAQGAESLVLLGDPQQLEQPSKGVHPEGAGVSALDHLTGGAATIAADRGLFLDRTWRLHPDLCRFTSELFYDGQLTSVPGLERQRVLGPEPANGAGLRLVTVAHQGNSNESPEEVEAVRALVAGLLDGGARWVNAEGEEATVGLDDILVVAPYNAQVSALKAALPDGARVGTVDKFQGQEAPIVVFSPATSTAADAPRGMEFLFSPSRLNVATSRARCVVVVVGSGGLFGPSCTSPRQMRLANGFCRFAEMVG